jgi:S1-C subfamily serine protease
MTHAAGSWRPDRRVDGQPVRNSRDLFRLLDTHEIGDRVTLRVDRPDGPVHLEVTLQSVR